MNTKDPVTPSVIKNMIPAILKRRGMTCADLVRALGDRPYDRKLTYTHLQHADRDISALTWDTIKRLSDVLEVSPYDLEPGNVGRPAIAMTESDRQLAASALHSFLLRHPQFSKSIARITAQIGISKEIVVEGLAFGDYLKQLEETKAKSV